MIQAKRKEIAKQIRKEKEATRVKMMTYLGA